MQTQIPYQEEEVLNGFGPIELLASQAHLETNSGLKVDPTINPPPQDKSPLASNQSLLIQVILQYFFLSLPFLLELLLNIDARRRRSSVCLKCLKTSRPKHFVLFSSTIENIEIY